MIALGFGALASGALDDAVRWLRQARAADPDHAEANRYLGEALYVQPGPADRLRPVPRRHGPRGRRGYGPGAPVPARRRLGDYNGDGRLALFVTHYVRYTLEDPRSAARWEGLRALQVKTRRWEELRKQLTARPSDAALASILRSCPWSWGRRSLPRTWRARCSSGTRRTKEPGGCS